MRISDWSSDVCSSDLDKLGKQYPHVHFEQIYTTVGPIRHSYEASMQALLEGAILAVIVVWISLRDWRATLIPAVALPLSILPTFAFIHRPEEHTSELQPLMRPSYAVFC